MDRHSSFVSLWLQLELCAMAVLLAKGMQNWPIFIFISSNQSGQLYKTRLGPNKSTAAATLHTLDQTSSLKPYV